MRVPVLRAEEIRAWDQYTIAREPISSEDLMERAARACVVWLMRHVSREHDIVVACGNGNNGGDGLAIARMLLEEKYKVRVLTESDARRSADNAYMFGRLRTEAADCMQAFEGGNPLPEKAIWIDALFGTGLSEAARGIWAERIARMNAEARQIISIDMPSGCSADVLLHDAVVVQATYTLTFSCFKPVFFYPEVGMQCGKIVLLDIGSHPDFPAAVESPFQMSTVEDLAAMYRPRPDYAHKGMFGHALLVAGHYGMAGAAVLSAQGCLRAGAGLLSVLIPDPEHRVLQAALPEAITLPFGRGEGLPDCSRFAAIGIGCGTGQTEEAENILKQILQQAKEPVILDADALNLLASWPDGLSWIPRGSLLTPHPREFDRLFGKSADSVQRMEKQMQQAQKLGVYILLKGRYSVLASPRGQRWGNLSGGPGMAKAGSGDVLTGVVTGLYAQYKNMETAARMGMWLHGRAGELAAELHGEESMLAGDLCGQLGHAFQEMNTYQKTI